MEIEVSSKTFREIDILVSKLSKEETEKYFYELIKIQEKYAIIINSDSNEVLNILKDKRNMNITKEDLNRFNLSNFSQKLSLRKTEKGIHFNISAFSSEFNYELGELLLGNDGEIHFNDKGSSEYARKNGIVDNKEAYLGAYIGMLYATGKILYNINNKLTIQKVRKDKETKYKKVKKKNSRKKEIQKIIVNKPIVIYTDTYVEMLPKEIETLKPIHNYKKPSWESRGYWRTNGKTGKREWVSKSVKTRKNLQSQEENIEVKKQSYVYK